MDEQYVGQSLFDFLLSWDKEHLEQLVRLFHHFQLNNRTQNSFRSLLGEHSVYYSPSWKGLFWYTDRYYSALAPVAQITLPELVLPEKMTLTLVIESSKPPRLFCRHTLLPGVLTRGEYYYPMSTVLRPGNLYLLLESPVQGKIRYLLQER